MNIKTLALAFPLLVLSACAPEPAATDAAATAATSADAQADLPASTSANAESAAASAPGDLAAAAANIEARLAAAHASKGQAQNPGSQACPSHGAGCQDKVGPNLHGVFGRPAGQAEGYLYSTVLRESGITWDAATMDQWLASPATMVPGTVMVFAGINDPVQRANLIAYLQQATAAP